MEDKKDLYKYKLNGTERESKLDLADYDSLVKKAKASSKEDLENYYIDKNNYKPIPLYVLLIFAIFITGILMGMFVSMQQGVYSGSLKLIQEKSIELCSYLPNGYDSGILLTGVLLTNKEEMKSRIICNSLNRSN